jgi:lysophospholipase L1-like esterase
MGFAGQKKSTRIAVGLACLVALVVGVAGEAVPASVAAPAYSKDHHAAARGYLALGDSVSFGYVEPNTSPPPTYGDASSFVGYPEDVAAALGLRVANAACPGETSASLVDTSAQSNGCESSPGGGPGYRTAYPLHVDYAGSQIAYAVKYLRTHRDTRLVSLMIGANDAFLCQRATPDQCATELPATLAQISGNVIKILSAIRHRSRYRGQIVIVNYYSLDYSNPVANGQSQLLDQAMNTAAEPFRVEVADGFGAFQAAALQSGGDSCKAGLLTQLTSGSCGIHPSAAGQAVLALAVAKVVKK